MSRTVCGVLAVVASCVLSQPMTAQWSVAPTIAGGPAIRGGVLRDRVSEGPTVKVGLWVRTPKLPVAITTKAMYAHFGPSGVDRAADGLRVGGLSFNLTTRRHDRRLDVYGTAGAGWCWHSTANEKYVDRQAPSFNVGSARCSALARWVRFSKCACIACTIRHFGVGGSTPSRRAARTARS